MDDGLGSGGGWVDGVADADSTQAARRGTPLHGRGMHDVVAQASVEAGGGRGHFLHRDRPIAEGRVAELGGGYVAFGLQQQHPTIFPH